MENLIWRKDRGQRSGIIEPAQKYLFYRGIQENG